MSAFMVSPVWRFSLRLPNGYNNGLFPGLVTWEAAIRWFSLGDLVQELVVGLERLEAVDEQLEAGSGVAGLVGSETAEHPAQLPHLLELLAVEQQLLVAGAEDASTSIAG
jgi:hypothetical protein